MLSQDEVYCWMSLCGVKLQPFLSVSLGEWKWNCRTFFSVFNTLLSPSEMSLTCCSDKTWPCSSVHSCIHMISDHNHVASVHIDKIPLSSTVTFWKSSTWFWNIETRVEFNLRIFICTSFLVIVHCQPVCSFYPFTQKTDCVYIFILYSYIFYFLK